MEFKKLEYFDHFNKLKSHIIDAGEKVIQMRDNSSFKVMIKPDDSPVSNADIWANDYLSEIMSGLFPGEIIIGEESEDKNYEPGAGKLWFVDPIDGTKNFVKGYDNFFILIGFCLNGIPDFGICYSPVKRDFVVGSALDGVFYIGPDDQPKQLLPSEWPDKNPKIIMKRIDDDLKLRLKKELKVERHPYIYDKVEMLGPLFGQSNGYVSMRKTAKWDLCAPAAIMRAAGYELAHNQEDLPVLFNNGSTHINFYYALPENTPPGVKKLLFQYQS